MKQAVILAAGEGQRLRPFTFSRPKAMIDIADKPVLQFIIEALVSNGVRDIICVVGYRKEQVFDYFGNGERFGADIKYVTQDRQLGTAHALRQVRKMVGGDFLVLSGDNLIEAATIKDFINIKPPAVLLKRVNEPARYGVVACKGKEVKSIIEKPKEAAGNLVNTGIYAFNKGIFSFAEDVLDIPDALNNMIAAGEAIHSLQTDGTWLDIVYPWDIIGLNNAILKNTKGSVGGTIEAGVTLRGDIVVGEGTVIRSGSCVYGPAVIGSGCQIGPNVCILPATSIGDNVVISSFTEVKNSVLSDDVNIGAGCIISDSIIGKGCVIKGRFTAIGGPSEVRINGECAARDIGAIMGEDCRVDNSVTVHPGAIIGNSCQIQMLKTISGQLPDRSLVY